MYLHPVPFWSQQDRHVSVELQSCALSKPAAEVMAVCYLARVVQQGSMKHVDSRVPLRACASIGTAN